MQSTSNKIQRGMNQQLQAWRESIARGHRRLGWKIGFNLIADQQRLNLPSAMIGYLTSEREINNGGSYHVSRNSELLVEPEIAVLIGQDVEGGATLPDARAAITAYAAAIELVDSTRSVKDDIEAILSGNLFHDAVLLSPHHLQPKAYSRSQLSVSLKINGAEVRTLEQHRVPDDFAPLICVVANILAANGEKLQAGDWIITGSTTKGAPVSPADQVSVDMSLLGKCSLTLT